MPKVVPFNPIKRKILKDEKCPKCGGGLDTGWECNDCGYDAAWAAEPDSTPIRKGN